jgi:hypothetical protein
MENLLKVHNLNISHSSWQTWPFYDKENDVDVEQRLKGQRNSTSNGEFSRRIPTLTME